MTVPLEAMLRRVSRIVEGMFAKSGGIDMTWLVQNADGAQRMLVTPVPRPEHKSALLEELREMLRRDGVTRYARATECWTGQKDDREDSRRWLTAHGSLAAYPKRREMVLFDADDGVAEYLMASREILRPEGGKPYLGKLSEIERLSKPPSGRFTWMLDVRPTTELADDEGHLFVTDVPGAPLQVFGRRGPTGELFVSPLGVVAGFREPIEDFVAETGFRPEIVTGPEAERLLAKVQRRIVKQ